MGKSTEDLDNRIIINEEEKLEGLREGLDNGQKSISAL